MTYCRQGHTLVDNEAEANWEQLVPGTNFELEVNSVTYFGTVDEYTPPTTTTLVCRLYSDAGRTTLVTTPIPTGLPYEVRNFVSFSWRKEDLQANTQGDIGTYVSPPVTVRDDTGVWTGNWIAEPKTEEQDSEVEFKFEGTHTLFTASVEAPLISEQAGVGLGAGTYEYCIVPVDGSSRLGAGSRILTITLAGSADILIDWLPNNQVSNWNVYGRQIGGSFGLMATLPGSTVSYLDNGTDVPNPALQPPLFEDPAWTPAVANKTVNISDNGIDSAGDISEDAIEISSVGQVLADASDVGGFTLDNTNENLQFDITNLQSTAQVTENVVLDSNLFDPTIPPTGQTYEVQYDFHVYTNDAGDKVVEETDSQTGQTKRLTFDQVAQTILVEIIENDIVIASDTVALDPRYTIPDDQSLSSTITYDNVRVLPDGTILGRETMEVNTYNVAPSVTAGIMWITQQNFGNPASGSIGFSTDGGANWTTFTIPGSRLIYPPGFSNNRDPFLRCHGHGWTVVCGVNHPFTPSLVSDFSIHWTNDLTAAPWPFNTAQGLVQAGTITTRQFDILNKGLSDTASNRMGSFDIWQPANGLGPFMQRNFTSDDQLRGLFAAFPDEFDIDFFFPATNTWTFQSPGTTKYKFTTVWPEKNLLIGLEDGAPNLIWTNPLTTNEAAPLGAQSFQHNISFTPNEIIALGTTRDRAYVVWKRTVTLQIGVSISADGFTWNDILLNASNDDDPRTPGNELAGLLPGKNSDPGRTGVMMWGDLTTNIRYSLDNGSTWLQSPTQAGGTFNPWQPRYWEHAGGGGNLIHRLFFWQDGTTLAAPTPFNVSQAGPDVHRMDPVTFANKSPVTGTHNLSDNKEVAVLGGSTIGSLGSPNGIPAANLRRYIGRSVVIPNDVAQPPPPFPIRDTTKSPVYEGRNTRTYQTPRGNVDIIIQTFARGGLGNTTYTNIDNGQNIMRDVPSNLPGGSFEQWKNPPVNMVWTSKF